MSSPCAKPKQQTYGCQAGKVGKIKLQGDQDAWLQETEGKVEWGRRRWFCEVGVM